MEWLEGKVALITGAARGQGRSHAALLASKGADVILVDLCAPVSDDVEYPAATKADLDGAVSEVLKLGRRAIGHIVDVRDFDALDCAVRSSVAELGSLDIVLANAGYVSWSRFWELSTAHWQTLIDVTLTGTFNTLKAAAPIMIEQGRGGSVVITSSPAGLKAMPGQMHYTTAKHGLVGLTRAAAIELGPYGIRVNSLHPHAVDTEMGRRTPRMIKLIEENPSYRNSFGRVIHDPLVLSCDDVSQTVLYMLSPAARLMTGQQVSLDAGYTIV
jgi:SDR family mycofactocin-dependent oxidoreductase